MKQPDTEPLGDSFDAKLANAADEAFLAQLMNAPPLGNRAERRKHWRGVRRTVNALRAWARDIRTKREARAVRKARRAARAARMSPATP